MTQEPEAIPIELVACATCDRAFLAHPGRQTCPDCGGDKGPILITFGTPEDLVADAESAPEEVAPPAEAGVEPPAAEPTPEPTPEPELIPTPPEEVEQ